MATAPANEPTADLDFDTDGDSDGDDAAPWDFGGPLHHSVVKWGGLDPTGQRTDYEADRRLCYGSALGRGPRNLAEGVSVR